MVLSENGKVTGLELDSETVACDGVFFAKNSMPPDSLLYGFLEKTAKIFGKTAIWQPICLLCMQQEIAQGHHIRLPKRWEKD